MFHVQVLDADNGDLLGQLVDVSRVGLMLAPEEALEVGSRYRLRIPLSVLYHGHRQLQIGATVAWTATAMHPAFHRNGLGSLELPEDQREALARGIDDHHMRAAD